MKGLVELGKAVLKVVLLFSIGTLVILSSFLSSLSCRLARLDKVLAGLLNSFLT